MRVSKQQLANYLGKNPNRIKKDYQAYLDALNIQKREYLTVFDIAKIDDMHPFDIAFIMQFPKHYITKLYKLKQYHT